MPNASPVQDNADKNANTLESFRLLADIIPTLCWMADASGAIYWYNKRWHDYTGLSSDTNKSADWKSAHDPKDHERSLDKWKNAIKTREPFDMVVSLRGADRIYRPFLSHIVPSKDYNGEVIGWFCIKNDISDLRAADKALQESEDRFRSLAGAMPQMAFMAKANGERYYYNKRWYDYVGCKEGAFDWARDSKTFIHPEDWQQTIATWDKSVKTGEDYAREHRLRRYDGSYRWHLARAVAVKNENEHITSWIGTNTDIHEQRRQSENQDFLLQAAKELSKSLDYKKTLKTIARLCVPVVADWCSVDLLNEDGAFEQVTVAHIDSGKIALAKEFRARNPVRLDDETSGVARVVKTGKFEYYPRIDDNLLESSIKDADTLRFMKSLQLHSVIVVPVNLKGKPMGAITLVASESGNYYSENDLSMAQELASRVSLAITNAILFKEVQIELKRSQRLELELNKEKSMLESSVNKRTKQLEQTNHGLKTEIERRLEIEAELQRSNQELQDFAYVASHDLQEPLRKIQAFGDILETEYGDKIGDGAEYIKRMHAAATRMSKLIEDLLVFSRVSTKQPVPSNVDLSEIVADVISDLENRITRTNGKVEVGALPAVLADPTHMRQLFQNLIANALKFHKEDTPPLVKVTSIPSKELDGFTEITIEDNGIGFDEKYADRIFGVFQRLHGRGSYEGTGIGLAVCRKIVEQYNGIISAKSHPGKGSKFIINLPTGP